MSKKPRLAAFALIAPILIGWVAACLDSPPGGSDGGTEGSTADSAGGDGTVSDRETDAKTDSGGDGVLDRAASDGPPLTDAQVEGGGLGLLVDNMTATNGTQISLAVAPGETPGSYSTYRDPNSHSIGTAQLSDTHVLPPVTNTDGSEIVGELCFGGGTNGSLAGTVVDYAGLNMNFAYGVPPDSAPDSGSSALPFDASSYSGVSFYIFAGVFDGPAASIRFGVPDTQTADPRAWPAAECAIDGGIDGSSDGASTSQPCDDDFASDLIVTPGTWTKVSFKWSDLAQQSWGVQFTALRTDQLIGMKWQANGAGVDAGAEPFQFCISDIYFTP
jgi:hypothetical protein